MSAHLGALLKSIAPRISIHVLEAAAELARESSDGWNNAGTGHAGLCELNYTPPAIAPGAPPDVSPALAIFARFERSRHFWGWAAAHGLAPRPAEYIRAVPHLSFVRGSERVAFLRARQAALSAHPFFRTMAFTADPALVRDWAPLLIAGRRADETIAATRVEAGTDVDFGELSRRLLGWLGAQEGCRISTGHRVVGLRRAGAGWELTVQDTASGETETRGAHFVFVGAGGGTLPLLQSAGLPVTRGLGAFPIAGQWLVCSNAAVVDRHFAKVYGPPPPDSGALGGPHLDVRHLGGRRHLLFGPFASWTTKFLHRTGRRTDLAASLRPGNLPTLLHTGLRQRMLVGFLIRQAIQTMDTRVAALREFYPEAQPADWHLVEAGIRVQALKRADAGRLSFGTEVVTSPDHSLAALLGASPGASVSTDIALQVIRTCFPTLLDSAGARARLRAMVPTFDLDPAAPAAIRDFLRLRAESDARLGLAAASQ
jgi:malate dehydrogenase (quinone)